MLLSWSAVATPEIAMASLASDVLNVIVPEPVV
jgi:hypothetical protein